MVPYDAGKLHDVCAWTAARCTNNAHTNVTISAATAITAATDVILDFLFDTPLALIKAYPLLLASIQTLPDMHKRNTDRQTYSLMHHQVNNAIRY